MAWTWWRDVVLGQERHTCPRRMLEYGPWPREINVDRYVRKGGLVTQHTVGLSCSFCGSLQPERMMELVEQGWWIEGTDKGYKWYLHRPAEPEDVRRCLETYLDQYRPGHIPEAIHEECERGPTVAKFYTAHLSRAQANRIIDLHGEGRLKHSIYVRPYFPALAVDAPDWLSRV